ncbi:hypothetical protein QJS66_10360 [Kocuria rhizophila]|nr:hypothetical protein QJS66_10360 [Kocuria rhizophila]
MVWSPYGPVLARPELLPEALRELRYAAHDHSVAWLRVEPQMPCRSRAFAAARAAANATARRSPRVCAGSERGRPRDIQPAYTRWVGVHREPEQILAAMTGTDRNLWRRRRDKGITLASDSRPDAAEAVIGLQHRTARRRVQPAGRESYLRTAARSLGAAGGSTAYTSSRGQARVVSALLTYDSPPPDLRPLRHGHEHARAAPQPAAHRPGAARRRRAGSRDQQPALGLPVERSAHPWTGFSAFKRFLRRCGRGPGQHVGRSVSSPATRPTAPPAARPGRGRLCARAAPGRRPAASVPGWPAVHAAEGRPAGRSPASMSSSAPDHAARRGVRPGDSRPGGPVRPRAGYRCRAPLRRGQGVIPRVLGVPRPGVQSPRSASPAAAGLSSRVHRLRRALGRLPAADDVPRPAAPSCTERPAASRRWVHGQLRPRRPAGLPAVSPGIRARLNTVRLGGGPLLMKASPALMCWVVAHDHHGRVLQVALGLHVSTNPAAWVMERANTEVTWFWVSTSHES